ncbi:MAG: hypothetical protein LBT94_02605 [Prevotellaceae bacterium]|jgi:hypothetical protein|nr:hypothetical protein [Prevotellaceae bacterium]
MDTFTKPELEEALQTFSSLMHKCEKAQKNFEQGTSQWTTLNRRINASRIASALIAKLLAES